MRASLQTVNSARSNKPFGECDPFTHSDCRTPAHADAASSTAASSQLFMPPMNIRGDIARGLFYMVVRYDGRDSATENLILTDCPDLNRGALGYLSAILQWHYDYPVSPEEITRNDMICEDYQHNRNPFIDYPDLVWNLYYNYYDHVCWDPITTDIDSSIAEDNTVMITEVASPSETECKYVELYNYGSETQELINIGLKLYANGDTSIG
eukprot:UN34792